jgi:hypothetical protein
MSFCVERLLYRFEHFPKMCVAVTVSKSGHCPSGLFTISIGQIGNCSNDDRRGPRE